MHLRDYLPSGQFSALTGAFLLSAGLIAAAAQTNPQFNPHVAQLYAAQTAATDLSGTNPDWTNAFAGDTVPQQMTDIQTQADKLSSAVQDKNLTSAIAKSLAIGTFSLQGQGLTESADAQSQLVQQAIAQVASQQPATQPHYLQTDVALSSNTRDGLRIYGNALPKMVAAHPQASEDAVFLPVSNAVDQNSGSPLTALGSVAREYRVLAEAIIKLPTPPIFVPLAMELANNYQAMAAAVIQMQQLHDDPVQGLLGLQNFKSISDQNAQLLLTIDSDLKTSGIVYGKGEPGAAWAQFDAAMRLAAQNAQTAAVPQGSAPQ